MQKKKVSAWIDIPTLQRLKLHSSMNLISGSSVIETALIEYFENLDRQEAKSA